MSWVPLEEFPALPGESWDALRKRWREAMAAQGAFGGSPAVKVRVPHTGRYEADLARFPDDPQAYIETEWGRKKLEDQRLREGWREIRDIDRKFDGKPAHMRDVRSAAEVAVEKVLADQFKERG